MSILLKNKSDDQIIQELSPQKFGTRGIIWTAILLILCCIGLFAYIRQLKIGLAVTHMGDYASWGIYISNFVFFVAISLVGSLVTAIFRLTNVKWSTPLTRIAEIIAVSAIVFAALIIIVDMGRPERLYYLATKGRIQSPILWDVIVISTYMVISLLLLYIPAIPDLKILLGKPNAVTKKLAPLYNWLSSFWVNSEIQNKLFSKSISILSVLIIPVAFCIHTVTSWLFATTFRPGWDSTNFGAYFISGAFLVGAGAVIVAMYMIRKAYRLEDYITEKHFDRMSKVLVMLALVYLYFNINEYLVPAYKMKKDEVSHLSELFVGEFAPMFWIAILMSMILPILILITKKGRKPKAAFFTGILVVIGAWFKRYLIVTPTMLNPFLPMHDVPQKYMHYFPSWEEWAIAIGSLAGALLIITIFIRIIPIIPIQETLNEKNEKALEN